MNWVLGVMLAAVVALAALGQHQRQRLEMAGMELAHAQERLERARASHARELSQYAAAADAHTTGFAQCKLENAEQARLLGAVSALAQQAIERAERGVREAWANHYQYRRDMEALHDDDPEFKAWAGTGLPGAVRERLRELAEKPTPADSYAGPDRAPPGGGDRAHAGGATAAGTHPAAADAAPAGAGDERRSVPALPGLPDGIDRGLDSSMGAEQPGAGTGSTRK